MNYWIFKANPEKYRIDERLKEPEEKITWRVTRYKDKIKADDIAFIWRAGTPRGIVAIFKIETNPKYMEEIPSESRYLILNERLPMLRVEGRLISRFPIIESEILKQESRLNGLSVFHGFQQATNFSVTHDEAEILLSLINTTN